jgi:hypothetical protein
VAEEIVEDVAAQRGIVDRASGAAISEAARKRMTHRAAAKLSPTPTFDDRTLTMFGLLTRLQAYNEGAAREIAADNPFASASCIRSLAEVVALVCYLIEKPQDLPRVSMHASDRDRIGVGKLLQAAQREAPGFTAIYAQLSNLAHPSYAGSTTSMEATEDGRFTWQSAPKFKNDDDARALYLWLLELTEAAGLLWCKLYDAVRGVAAPPPRASTGVSPTA